jgi:hypothetical protein
MVTRFPYPERFEQFSTKCPPNAFNEKIGSSEKNSGLKYCEFEAREIVFREIRVEHPDSKSEKMEVRTNRLTEKKQQDADPDYPGLLRLSGVVLATPSSQTWSQGAPLHSKPGPTASN